ncbi:MAG: ParB/RepB/Spo0J family partition protein, partial [Parcubacteria group bacterium]
MAFGLGRGLEALIPSKTARTQRPDPIAVAGVTELALGCIAPNPLQPRKQFKLPELEELAGSIREHGVLEPLIVSPTRQSGHYVLVAGERRLRAAELAGLKRVPVVVRQTDDLEKLEFALIENIQRQDLNPLEQAKALRRLLREFNLSQEQVARKLGQARPTIANCLRLLDLAAEVQRALLAEVLTSGHARALLALSSQDQVTLLHEIESRHLSVRQTEQRVRELLKRTVRHAERRTLSPKDPQADEIGRKLSQALGARVRVVSLGEGGRIEINYHTKAERERLT